MCFKIVSALIFLIGYREYIGNIFKEGGSTCVFYNLYKELTIFVWINNQGFIFPLICNDVYFAN